MMKTPVCAMLTTWRTFPEDKKGKAQDPIDATKRRRRRKEKGPIYL